MTHPAFAPLQAAYDDRLGLLRRARAEGRPVAGYVGNTVPVELIHAAGMVPLRLAPVAGDPALADAQVEAFSDRDMRLLFADDQAGHLEGLALLIVPRSTETQHKLYLALREARRTAGAPRGPALWLYDILHTQRPSSAAYGLARTHELAEALARHGGRRPDAQALDAAIASFNALRVQLQRLQGLRQARPVPSREALVATGAWRFMAPEEAGPALARWLDALEAAPAGDDRRPRLLVTGCALDHDALHRQVDAAGGRIVFENDEWGSRGAEPLVATDRPALQALFDHCHRGVPCVRRHPAPAVDDWLAGRLNRRSIDGVLFHLPVPDDIHGWHYPAQRDAVAAAGLPSLCLRRDAREGALPGLTDFIASLRP